MTSQRPNLPGEPPPPAPPMPPPVPPPFSDFTWGSALHQLGEVSAPGRAVVTSSSSRPTSPSGVSTSYPVPGVDYGTGGFAPRSFSVPSTAVACSEGAAEACGKGSTNRGPVRVAAAGRTGGFRAARPAGHPWILNESLRGGWLS